jgi:hypothetical protein
MMLSRTQTNTQTQTRTAQLARQVNLFVSTVTGSSSFREVIMRGAEERWIEEVIVELLGEDEKIRHRAILEIDWEAHSVALSRSGHGVIAEKRFDPATGWLGGALSELARDLDEISRQANLTACWSVRYSAAGKAEIETVRAALGLSQRDRREWAEGERQILWGPDRDADMGELSFTWEGVIAPDTHVEGD